MVTIGIPVFNEEKYLAATIESAINQTYKNIQILISDNCSSDNSYNMALEYGKSDSRIKVVRQEKNIGVVDNFKYLINASDTKYFLWLGAHDLLKDSFIEEAVNKMENDPSIALVYPKSVFVKNGQIGVHADSDIDTQGLDKIGRVKKIISNLEACTAIHGLFKSEFLKSIPINYTGCDDHLAIFLAAAEGQIISSKDVQFHRRIVREESEEEVKKRYKEFGYFFDNTYSIGSLIVFNHIKSLFMLKGLSLKQKIDLSQYLRLYFPPRFGNFSWGLALKYFLKRDFNLLMVVYMLGLIFYQRLKS